MFGGDAISCWGGYINLQQLVSLRAEHTSVALRKTVEFFRTHGAEIDTVRMDNQQSPALLQVATELELQWNLVPPHVKNPNRTERAIRTAKNHLIATRAGFHPDCPTTILDTCLFQIELTLNIVKPFEYHPCVSAYEGIYGSTFNFVMHPIAPVGTKVLTWDAPDHRGAWADHGVPAVYLGPAPDHLRSFEVWVPNTSAARITNTVWWFLHDGEPDSSLLSMDMAHACPPSRDRPDPQPNGADLVGRAFFEPEIGVCLITGLGPVVRHKMATRVQLRRRDNQAPLLCQGEHYTLTYTQTSTGEEHFSSLHEVLHWIQTGPALLPPEPQTPVNTTEAPITTPPFTPAMIQYVPTRTSFATNPALSSGREDVPPQKRGPKENAIVTNHEPRTKDVPLQKSGSGNTRKVVTFQAPARKTTIGQNTSNHKAEKNMVRRASPRLLAARTMEAMAPAFQHGKQRVPERGSNDNTLQPGRQRVPARGGRDRGHHSGKQRVMRPEGLRAAAHLAALQPADDAALGFMSLPPIIPPPGFKNMTVDEDIERFRLLVEGTEWPEPNHSSDGAPSSSHCLSAKASAQHGDLTQALPKSCLDPVFPTGPLNLNPDGTAINYRKSHAGPHAAYWANADGEEIERLFVTGTIKPLLFRDIPKDKIITYANPVCVEKTHDDGTLKFRTRFTIGGDRIQYPYDTAAVTAEMDAVKIMLNCMISEDANWTTVDLTDFYLGTDLPHPEYIRIPRHLIPNTVIEFYALSSFFNNDALYCSVHKTHYGLPQAGALN
jgi:hypothetical protein